jgi:membrane-anchored mycosin MYCP
VLVGADVASGDGRGDLDCLGTGTAMAGIIAGNSGRDDDPVGMAPDATILPVRVVDTDRAAASARGVAAIEVAVAAGATVIALGSYVDLTDSAVATAVSAALTHDVLVVAPAPTTEATRPGPAVAGARGALLTVAGVSADNRLADDYRPAGVDVVAPGVGVAGLGRNGSGTVEASGTQYAVAFAAGQAALVRAAYPELSATQVKHRIEATADRLGDGAPDQRYGWGMISPAAAVTAPVAGEQGGAAAAATDDTGVMRTIVLVALVLILIAAVALLLFRSRGWTRDVYL